MDQGEQAGQVPPHPPIHVAGYEAMHLLGRGGMGEVYLARQLSLDRLVALKVLRFRGAIDDDLVARFGREARAAASLTHPHIVPVYDHGEWAEGLFISMGYMSGGTLASRIASSPLPGPEAARIGAEIASALAYAHGKDIVHRDVKPSNVLLDEAGNAALADFGIARVAAATRLTGTQQVIGTPIYMAPELTTGASASPASDVYALGVTLYEAVTGTPPFDAEDPYSILYRHRHDPVPSLEVDPPELAGAIVQALAKDPAGRSDGTDALARTLRSIAAGRHAESLAPTVGALAPTGVPGVDTGPEPVDRPSPVDLPEAPAAAGPTGGGEDGGRRPGRAALAVAGVVGLVLAIVAATSLFGGEDPGDGGSPTAATGATGVTGATGESGTRPTGPTAPNVEALGCTLVGTEADDLLEGTQGVDVMCGLGGDDTLFGFGGNDLLVGAIGDDLLVGGPGEEDYMDGGPGTDTVDYSDATSAMEVSTTNRGAFCVDGTDSCGHTSEGVVGIENVIGTAFDDFLLGDPGDNEIFGGDGNDEIHLDPGVDCLQEPCGDDVAHGGPGDDFITGNFGENRLFGDDGDDELITGPDADALHGGQGTDTCTGGGGTDSLSACEA